MARQTGVKPGALRAWEASGLLVPERTPSGQRRYGPEHIERIRRIDHLRKILGYNLNAIRTVLDDPHGPAGNAAAAGERPSSGPDLATRLRALRRERQLTVRELARRAGVAASFISMIERKRATPSATTLSLLAHSFGITLGELFGSTVGDPGPVVRAGTGRVVTDLSPAIEIEQIHVGLGLMDSEVWTLAPGAHSQGSYAHSGEELVRVLDGTFEIALDGGAPVELHTGDTIHFKSEREHWWRNPGDRAARVLWVNVEPGRLLPGARSMEPPYDQLVRACSPPDAVLEGRGPDTTQMRLSLPPGSRAYRYLDTHTAGHPTRIFLDLPGPLPAGSVRAQRDAFRNTYDRLRSRLLHEPRGQVATFGLFPVPSDAADFGAFFISSDAYLDMCGHSIIGYSRALESWGLLAGRESFTLETPAGVVTVQVERTDGDLTSTIFNVPCRIEAMDLPVALPDGRTVSVDIAYGGCLYALVGAEDLGETLEPERSTALMFLGDAVRGALAAGGRQVSGVLFHAPTEDGAATRQFALLKSNTFARSPCATGMSARMAQLHARG
ncbi:MAG: proline racemase family protein, partial [Rhodospirillaceae bacterium]|nr:proline racemase family protein [Rhodospirillaceae bacterium]